MPRHKQVATCRRSGGPVSKMCPCEHCSLAVCSVCGEAAGGLTTDCPGVKIDADRSREIYETALDYTDERGWYLAQPGELQVTQYEATVKRSPRFESTATASPPQDPRAVVAPSINWAAVDRIADLKDTLSQKAIAWVLADRIADDHSAKLTRLEREVAEHLPQGQASAPDAHAQELLKALEYEKIGFHLANQRADKCDDEFRQAARRLVAALEEGQVVAVANDKRLFTRTCGCTVVAGDACPHVLTALFGERK